MKRKTSSPFKIKLMEFLKATNGENKVFNLDFDGLRTEEEAKAFVGQMRVELSRARKHVRDRNQAIKPFKVLIVEIKDIVMHVGEEHPDGEFTRVVLQKSFEHEDVFSVMDEVMPEISAGSKLVGVK